jgi:hypothetical protein
MLDKLNRKPTLPAVFVAAVLSAMLLAAVWFSHAADFAMDKSGVGDMDVWSLQSSRAAVCYAMFAAVWFLSLVSSFALPQPGRGQLRLVCVGALILLPFGLFSWAFLM